ncbi:hypothetical protein GCM10010246_02380 [Streptomyces cuspidosporus]|uniref:Transposase n=1 Tax=Streptomyces cuspidosporus TaxID=66882 RepID=A0ABP5SA02_9ACTN
MRLPMCGPALHNGSQQERLGHDAAYGRTEVDAEIRRGGAEARWPRTSEMACPGIRKTLLANPRRA